jgi:hypothetical protein
MSHTLEEAVQVAVTVSTAERVRASDTKRVFSAKRDSSTQGIICYNCGNRGHIAKEYRSPRKNGTPARDGRVENSNYRHTSGAARAPKRGVPHRRRSRRY